MSILLPEYRQNLHFIKFDVLPNIERISQLALSIYYRCPDTAKKLAFAKILGNQILTEISKYNYWNFTDEKLRVQVFKNRYLIGKALFYALYFTDATATNFLRGLGRMKLGTLTPYKQLNGFEEPPKRIFKNPYTIFYNASPDATLTLPEEATRWHLAHIYKLMYDYLHLQATKHRQVCAGYELFLNLAKEHRDRKQELLQLNALNPTQYAVGLASITQVVVNIPDLTENGDFQELFNVRYLLHRDAFRSNMLGRGSSFYDQNFDMQELTY